jgi:hypothetical protein
MIYLTLHMGKYLFCVTFKKYRLKLILYVLDLKNLHNETFPEIIYTKFREMYWYLKNLHNETISRHNLYKISRNVLVFEKLKSLLSLFRISRNKKNAISRPPNFASRKMMRRRLSDAVHVKIVLL